MKRWWRAILLFIALYLMALIATLPAALVVHWAKPLIAQIPQRPQLIGIGGTIWSGHATQLRYQGVSLGTVEWKLAGSKLLLGKLEAHVKLNGSDTRLDTRLSWQIGSKRFQISQLEGRLPAGMLKDAVPNVPVMPTGDITMAITDAQMDNGVLYVLDGRAIWSKGGVTSPMALEFGDLVAEFKTQAEQINGHIHDSGGPLQLDAQLSLMPDNTYTLNGKLATRSNASPALTSAVGMLGKPDSGGMIPLKFSGTLKP